MVSYFMAATRKADRWQDRQHRDPRWRANLLDLNSSQYRLLLDTASTRRVTIQTTEYCADRLTPIEALKYLPHHSDQRAPLPPTAWACQIGSISISAGQALKTIEWINYVLMQNQICWMLWENYCMNYEVAVCLAAVCVHVNVDSFVFQISKKCRSYYYSKLAAGLWLQLCIFAATEQYSSLGRLQYEGWQNACCTEVEHDAHFIF